MVFDCQACGLASERKNTVETVAEHVTERGPELVEGEFPACVNCESIDVDVYSDEGWQIEMRVRETAERS